MTRLVIDARLVGHSGIGTYLREILPRIVPRVGQWRPRVLSGGAHGAELAKLIGRDAEIVEWNVAPLSMGDLWSSPPDLGSRDLLWTPHFNVPLRNACTLAVTLHDLLPLTAPDFAGHGRSLPVRAWLRAIRNRARVVFCVSDFTRREALRLGALDPAKLQVTPLGADQAWFAAGESTRLAVTGEQPSMIFVGLLKPHKNVARLLRAFARVRDLIPHRVVLVARHRGVRNIDRAALELAATHADRVEIVQDLPFAELVARVAAAQFAVQPSLHEGFCLPALEAMAAGVPVLAGRAGALPEVCGDAAVYCDPRSEEDIAQAMLQLAGDAALRARLALAGRGRAHAFSWDACAIGTALHLDSALRTLDESGS